MDSEEEWVEIAYRYVATLGASLVTLSAEVVQISQVVPVVLVEMIKEKEDCCHRHFLSNFQLNTMSLPANK